MIRGAKKTLETVEVVILEVSGTTKTTSARCNLPIENESLTAHLVLPAATQCPLSAVHRPCRSAGPRVYPLTLINLPPGRSRSAQVSLISYNDGAPRASRVVAAMYMRGFDLLDIVEQHHWNVVGGQQVLGQVDLMFAKKDSNLFDAYGRAMNLRVGKKKRSASKSRRAGLLL